MPLRILINCTTLIMGGALQVASSLFKELHESPATDLEIFWAVSTPLWKQIQEFRFGEVTNVRVFEKSPARYTKARKQLLELESEIRPAAIFTVFGPAYVRFRAAHLCGVADGWVTHATLRSFASLGSFSIAARILASVLYKSFWFRYADRWVVEAKVAKAGLVGRHHLPEKHVAIVKNTCSSHFQQHFTKSHAARIGPVLRIICVSAYYRHKNLESIPRVAHALQQLKSGFHFEFLLTISQDSRGAAQIERLSKRLGVSQSVRNIGPISVRDTPTFYEKSHIAFLPSLLETFSANYPEAMAAGIPIVTTDFDFARDACGNAARYFPPGDYKEAARAILEIASDQSRARTLIENGREILKSLPSAHERMLAYIGILKDMTQ